MDIVQAYKYRSAELLNALNSSVSGITEAEARDRLQRYGPNELQGKKKVTPVVIFFRQFLNPLVYILVAAATIKAVVKGPLDALTIIVVLLFMALVGFVQEYRAGKAMDALMKLSAPKAKVKRGGIVRIVASREIVPGDVVILEAGDKVPADARLLEAASLKVNESSLTGESLPVDKNIVAIEQEVSLGGRIN